ncbi:MAG: YIP1 family protein [Pseudomonadota bacterium]
MSASAKSLVMLCFRDPAEAARQVLDLGLPMGIALQIGIAAALIEAVTVAVLLEFSGGVSPEIMSATPQPFALAAIQIGVMVGSIIATWLVGRALGGTGDLLGSATIVTAVYALYVLGRVAGVFVSALIPPLSVLLVLGVVLWIVWVFAHGVRVLHGFHSTGLVVLGIVLSASALLVALSLVLVMLGFGQTGSA